MKKFILIIGFFVLIANINLISAQNLNNAQYWENSKKITVYVPQNRRRTIIKKGFENWQKATNSKINFVFLDFSTNSNIQIEFVEIIPNGKLKSGEILGLTKSQYYPDGRIKKATIQIPYKGQNNFMLDSTTLEKVLTHEIGHALGLEHSKDKTSLMYATTEKNQTIKQEDINNLQKIYNWK